MELTINNEKLKIKYILNVYKTLSCYPTKEDIVYDLLQYFNSNNMLEPYFTNKVLNKIYGKDVDISELLEKQIVSIKKSSDKGNIYELKVNLFL